MALFGKSNGQPRQIDILKFCEVDDVGLMKGKCPYIHIYINITLRRGIVNNLKRLKMFFTFRT